MLYNYDIINKNIEVFNKAVDEISLIKEFIAGKVNISILSKLNLTSFGEFYLFLKEYSPVIENNVTWKTLKPQIIESTTTERFKIFIKNRSEKKFIADLSSQKDFDRLLMGRILGISKRGYKRRSNPKIEGLQKNSIQLIKFVIQNQIDCDLSDLNHIKWFTTPIDYKSVQKREANISATISNSILKFIENEKIDFRKINTEYITSTISDKLKEMMLIPKGTMVKSLESLINPNNIQYLTKDKYYEVDSSFVSSGSLYITIKDDINLQRQCSYKYFEDMSVLREGILSELFN